MPNLDCIENEIVPSEDDLQAIVPETTKTKVRNLIGFWLLGLCNNYPYVIMLTAAYDLLDPKYHGGNQQNNTSQNVTECNHVSTGAILLADIIPCLFIKFVAPFIAIKTSFRVVIAVSLCAMSFLITSFSNSDWVTFLGVICAALSSGLGEITYLSYSTYFNKNVVSTWSSGTGGAGLFGSLSYAVLTRFFNVRPTLQIMLVMPLLTVITFWFIIEHPSSISKSCRGCCGSSETYPMLPSSIDMSAKNALGTTRRPSYTLKEKIYLIKPLLKYMVPLGIVYFAEYFINQGLMELLYFTNIKDWLSHQEQYHWYQVDYQLGVLISRSSVNLFKVRKLWILPFLQVINAFVLLFDAYFFYIKSIWIVFAIIFFEGLLGGCAYVNTFYRITSEVVEKDREFSMGIASLSDSIGISLAGIVALPVHDVLCKLSLSK